MDTPYISPSLTAEQQYALGEIVEKGNIIQIKKNNYLLVPVSPMLVDFLKASGLQNLKKNKQREFNDAPPEIEPKKPTKFDESHGLRLTELIEKFREAKSGDWCESTSIKYARVFRILLEVLGENKRAKDITPNDIADVKSVIVDLPYHYPNRHTKSVTLVNAADLANHLGLRRRGHTTINLDLCDVMTFFKWAQEQWHIDRNPCGKIKIPRDKIKKQHRRFAFSDEQLNIIFHAPIFTGCINDLRGYKRPGSATSRRHRFWVPLIALFSGLRLHEIVQLETVDIKKIDSNYFFSIDDGPYNLEKIMALKNEHAQRLVPVHNELVKIGFLSYLEQIRSQGHQKLFPHFKMKKIGQKSGLFSVWFNDGLLESLGAKTAFTTFHSFRHNFRDATREAELPPDGITEIGGWSRNQLGPSGHYGNGLSPKTLAKYMKRVRYPQLDLSHLYQ